MDTQTLVPDGGWGWVIVAAVALINMTNQSILSVFGLLFGSQLKEMQHETFTAALITNLNSLALNFSGLFIGPAIKSFKPRNVASTGCVMVSFGLMLCAFATRGWHFIIGYSFFVGIGLGLIAPSTFMVINSYFTTKRGRAVGISLAGGGLGQVFMPHIVRIFLEHYGFRSAVIVLSLLSLTGLIGTLLLKPLNAIKHNNHKHLPLTLETICKQSKDYAIMEIKISNSNFKRNDENIFGQKCHETALLPQTNKVCKECSKKIDNNILPDSEKLCSKICRSLVQAMDLELLKDPAFWSIIIGMALVYTSTINFTMVFPSFLQYSVGLTKSTIANCMSTMAGADIICRLLLPCITDKLKIPYRLIFLLGTVGLLISRAALAESMDLISIIVMSIFTGITKSATVLNNNLTISGHVKPDKLPGGLGLNMIFKGILVITIGQLLGWIRDYTGSYILCLHAQNCLLLLVIVAWTPEICFKYHKQIKEKKLKKRQELLDVEQRITEKEDCLHINVNTKNDY